MTNLTIVTQNIRSIYRNIDNFLVTISQLDFEVDILVFTECRLNKNKSIPYIPNYTSLATTNNLNQNDGVVIYAKSDLQPVIKEIKLLHASCIQINILNHLILGIYRSPSIANASGFIESLCAHLETVKSYNNIIIAGDININLNPAQNEQSTDSNNRINYLNMLATHSILSGHKLPTRETSCLDHIMVKLNESKFSANIAIINTAITDHETVLLSISNIKNPKICRKTIVYIDYNKAYNDMNHKNLESLLICNDPNSVTNQLLTALTEILENSKIRSQIPRKQRTIKPWITPGILRCIRNRNKMQIQARSDPHNEILKITYKRYRNYCNNLIKKLKRKYERELLESTAKNSKDLWKTIKNVTNLQNKKSYCNELITIKPTPLDSVNSINSSFASVGKNLANEIKINNTLPPTGNVRVHKCPSVNSHCSSFVLLETDPQEVSNIIMDLKSVSAPGWDNIPTKFIKMCNAILSPIISHLANLCFKQGIFPTSLKKSVVTPVHKGGDKDDINNYRPISVLPAVSKVIEKLINNRLINYLNKFNIISNSQYGFRHGLSTEDAVLDLTSLIADQLDQRKKCLTVFLDLKKAFDSVSLPTLVHKLEIIGIRGIPLNLFTDYLYNRKQCVKIENYVSSELDISFGVPQGSVLGPTLFLIYVNDLANIGIEGGKVYSYADDTAIVFSGPSWSAVHTITEAGLVKISDWLKKNLLTLNINKTNYICFAIKNRLQPSNEFSLKLHECNKLDNLNCDCKKLARVFSTKYLGVMLDSRLSWHVQIEYVNEKIRKLIWIFKTLRHITSRKLLNQIYVSLVQSVLGYCIPIWGGATRTKFLEVERGQRLLLKVMYFKRRRFPTTDLYKLSDVLTVRQLYILLTVLRRHKISPYDCTLPTCRRKFNVVKHHRTRTSFAKRQFNARSALLYNQINKIIDIHKLKYRECKTSVTEWIKKLTYNDTETLLQISINL